MDIIQSLVISIIILLAIPLGIWLSKITKEELKAGRKAFKMMVIISIISIISTLFLKLNLDAKIFIIASMLFILLLALTSLKISSAKRSRRKR